jgi:hypothetical protein
LLASILRIQNSSNDLIAVKLFTANIKARYARRRCEQVLLCTNDSDLAPAVEFIRSDCPKMTVGIVLPRPPELKARKSRTLQDLAHWTRDHILDQELAAHQLPPRVQTGKKPVDKPAHW